MIHSITELIFTVLCGVLFAIGTVFGLDYETVSVYICIYFLPLLCVLMPASIAVVAIYNWIKRLTLMTTLNLGLSLSATYSFLLIAGELTNPYIAVNNYRQVHTIHEKFIACRDDLIIIASNLNMTYEEVNLWIYCCLPIIITLFMWVWFELTIPKRWVLNRLWLPKSSNQKD